MATLRTVKEQNNKHACIRYCETQKGRANRLWGGAQVRSSKKGIEFSLSIERVQTALEEGECEVTGIPFDFKRGTGKRNPFGPSLDRKDPDKGYTDSNVQVVVYIHNLVRSNWGDEPLKKYILGMLQYARVKRDRH